MCSFCQSRCSVASWRWQEEAVISKVDQVAALYGTAQRPNLSQATPRTHCLCSLPDHSSHPFLCPSQYTLISKPQFSFLLRFPVSRRFLGQPNPILCPLYFLFYFPSLGGVCSHWEGTRTMFMNIPLYTWDALSGVFCVLHHQLWNQHIQEGVLQPGRRADTWKIWQYLEEIGI